MKYFKEALAMPVEAGKLGLTLGLRVGKFAVVRARTVGRPSQPVKPIALRLQQESPLHDARLGAGEVLRGIEHGDDQLTQLGAGAIALALLKASDSPAVPDAITEEVAGIAESLPINPAESPLLSQSAAEHAAEIIKQFTSE
ncbi:MAG: hypothetical protein JWM81_1171 [Candidatus Saccharibacteria bacterium]|nr:hypothetical protein [Candidatus Saccharibacteria bacterium]